ncbi:MAG: cyanophycinase [Planctomycetota bacterium]
MVLVLIRVLCGMAICDAIAAQATGVTPPTKIDPRGVRGTRVLGGGGKLPSDIYERFLFHAGSKRARRLIVPTASKRADTAEGRQITLQRWQKAHPGHQFEVLHTRDRSEADGKAFAKKMQAATAVWFGGGAQSRLAEAYVGTRFERELHALLERGGVVGGSSAGTAIQTRTMIAGGKAPPRLMTGFDLVPFAIADQHFSQRKRLPRLLLALELAPGHFGIGIDEGTAVVVWQRAVHVLGKGKVHFALAKTKTQQQRIVTLGAGGQIDLPTWQRAARQRELGAWPPAKLPPPTVKTGSLVLAGGDHVPDQAFERFVALAGGAANARIVIVPIATPWWRDRESYVIKHRILPVQRKLRALSVTNIQLLTPEHPNDVHQRHTEMLEQATGVWFTGGRSWHIIDAFDGTPIPMALHRVLERGGVIGGMASVQSDFLLRGDPLSPKPLHCEGYDHGLGFLLGCAIDDQFAPHQGIDGLKALITKHPQLLGIDLNDHTAAVVTGDMLEVLGTQKVTIVQRRTEQAAATTTTLTGGEQWHLRLGKRNR